MTSVLVMSLDLLMSTDGWQECFGRDVKIREHHGRMGPTFCDVTQVSAQPKLRSAASATPFSLQVCNNAVESVEGAPVSGSISRCSKVVKIDKIQGC